MERGMRAVRYPRILAPTPLPVQALLSPSGHEPRFPQPADSVIPARTDSGVNGIVKRRLPQAS